MSKTMLLNWTRVQWMTLAAIVVSSAVAAPASAKNWADGTSNWNVPANWNPAAVPTSGEAVNIINTDGTARSVTLNVTPPALGLTTIDLTGAGTAADTLSITSNFNLTAGGLLVGGHNGSTTTSGRGAISQSAGAVATSAGLDFVLGDGAGSTGTYTLSGTGTLTAAQSEYIGYAGNGTFNQSAGTNSLLTSSVGSLDIGILAGATGTYNLNGGTLTANTHVYVGDGGTGTFNQTIGTNTIQGAGHNLNIGFTNGGVGNYTISGNGLLSVANDINLGNAGTAAGTLSIQGTSTVTIANNLNLNAHGTLNLSGGTLRTVGYNPVAGGVLNYTAGTLRLGGASRTIGSDATITAFFGGTPTIAANKALATEGITDVNVNTTVLGKLQALFNSLRIGSLTNNSVTTLTITNGGTVTAAGDSIVGMSSTSAGVISVDGSGSSFSAPYNLQLGNLGNGVLNISNGATVSTDSGTLGSSAANASGTASLSGDGSKWTTTNGLTVGNAAGTAGTLTVQTGATALVGTQLTINPTGVVTLNGGTLRFNTLSDPGNKLQFNTGTLQLAGNRDLGTDPVVMRFFGGTVPTIGPGKNLTVEGTASTNAGLSIQGGTLKAGSLSVSSPFQFTGGVLEMTGGSLSLPNSRVAVPTGGEFRALGTISQLISGAAGSTITATGNLTLGAPFNFDGFYTDGTLAIGANTVTLSDFNDAVFDSGAIATIGVGVAATPGFLNAANGITLDFGGNFVGYGTVTTPNNSAKPFINNGHIYGFAAGEPITLTGYVKGVGTFDLVNFTGTYSPGLSPASVNAGSLGFSSTSTLVMELGGTTAGSQYDQILATGALALGGTLEIDLINGFTPSAGSSFNLFDWGSASGAFSSLNLPTLSAGLSWNTSQLYTTGVISVASAGIPGDFNGDGAVNAADYITWRKGLGTTFTQSDYDVWRAHFGQTAGSGAGAIANSAVPEPATCVLLVIAAAGLFPRRRRSA
jgi:T5SS/PEP-CTERM-associated repeat protein